MKAEECHYLGQAIVGILPYSDPRKFEEPHERNVRHFSLRGDMLSRQTWPLCFSLTINSYSDQPVEDSALQNQCWHVCHSCRRTSLKLMHRGLQICKCLFLSAGKAVPSLHLEAKQIYSNDHSALHC